MAPRYVYSITDGLASNLHFAHEDYVLKPGEQDGRGELLPMLEWLCESAALQARDNARDIAAKKAAALSSLETKEREAKLAAAVKDKDAPPEVVEYANALKGKS